MPTAYIYLVVAVIAETIGTSALQASAQFTKFWPSVLVVAGYAIAFYFLGLTLKYVPVGVAYALWSGLGIVFISIIGVLVFSQKLDFAAIAGMSMIIAGIVVIQLFSSSSSH